MFCGRSAVQQPYLARGKLVRSIYLTRSHISQSHQYLLHPFFSTVGDTVVEAGWPLPISSSCFMLREDTSGGSLREEGVWAFLNLSQTSTKARMVFPKFAVKSCGSLCCNGDIPVFYDATDPKNSRRSCLLLSALTLQCSNEEGTVINSFILAQHLPCGTYPRISKQLEINCGGPLSSPRHWLQCSRHE